MITKLIMYLKLWRVLHRLML